jgi:hypothetical protein
MHEDSPNTRTAMVLIFMESIRICGAASERASPEGDDQARSAAVR